MKTGHFIPPGAWPAALSQGMAAAYCGMSVSTFSAECPVLPIIITKPRPKQKRPNRRYLRQRLDEWLFSLENASHDAPRIGMGAMMDAKSET